MTPSITVRAFAPATTTFVPPIEAPTTTTFFAPRERLSFAAAITSAGRRGHAPRFGVCDLP